MSVKLDNNGDFVQTVENLESNVVSDLYDILSKSETSVGTIAHEVRKELDVSSDSSEDIAQWCSLVNSVPVVESNDNHDGTLGAAFYYTTSYSANDYTGYSGKYSSINTEPLGETEEYAHQKDLLVKQGIVNDEEVIEVPVTSDGDVLPVIAVSNDRDESHPTFEEAKETLQKLMDSHFEEVEVVEASNDSDDSGSDTDDDFFLSEIDKVGPATSENIKEYLIENQATLDWREHIDPESDDWRTTIITKDEAKDRLQQVALEMDSDDFSKAMTLIEQGNTDQAIMAIEQYE